MSPTTAQIGAIHAMAKKAGMDEDARRDFIAARAGGKRSSRDLTVSEAGVVIEALQEIVPREVAGSRRSAARTVTGRWAGVLRALWISGWNLGVVLSRDDEALIAFVERQTGLSHPRFLVEPADARKAIEGIKAWLAREAGVDWGEKHRVPSRNEDGIAIGWTDFACPKRNVLWAQFAILRRLGLPEPDWPKGTAADEELDALQRVLGDEIRRAGKKGKGKRRAAA